MGEKKPEMAEMAWVSRLWAQYNMLSEPLKRGFYALVQSTAKDTWKNNTENSHTQNEKLMKKLNSQSLSNRPSDGKKNKE